MALDDRESTYQRNMQLIVTQNKDEDSDHEQRSNLNPTQLISTKKSPTIKKRTEKHKNIENEQKDASSVKDL